MTQLLGDFMLWSFCVTNVVMMLLFMLKTQWFKMPAGRILFLYLSFFTITAFYIAGRKLGIIPSEVGPWFYFLVFGVATCASIANIILVLKRNRHYWAWSD